MKTGGGYAVVIDADDKPSNLVGPLNLAAFYQKSGVASRLAGLRVRDRASNPLFTISEKATVLSAIRPMLDRHARRLLVEESKLVVDDRRVIKWLL